MEVMRLTKKTALRGEKGRVDKTTSIAIIRRKAAKNLSEGEPFDALVVFQQAFPGDPTLDFLDLIVGEKYPIALLCCKAEFPMTLFTSVFLFLLKNKGANKYRTTIKKHESHRG